MKIFYEEKSCIRIPYTAFRVIILNVIIRYLIVGKQLE